LETYAVILSLVRGICETLSEQDEYLDRLLGIHTDLYERGERPDLFRPELVENQIGNRKKVEKPKTIPEVKTVSPMDDTTDKLLRELEALRGKVSRQDTELKKLRLQYTEAREEAAFLKANIKKYENDRTELIALRNHLYHSTEDDIGAEARVPVEKMKHFLSDKKIVVIGGHLNWVRKLRSVFPQWIFYAAGSNNTADTNVLLNSDRIFFFTDVLDHKTYHKFMNTIQENKLKFGYIHSVYIEGNIRQIYEELME
jgi:hypothetical protein